MDHFSGKRFSTTWPFPIFENKFFNGWNYCKTIFQNNVFIKKLLNLIIDLFSKIGNGQVVENLFSEKMIHYLSESNYVCNYIKKNSLKKVIS